MANSGETKSMTLDLVSYKSWISFVYFYLIMKNVLQQMTETGLHAIPCNCDKENQSSETNFDTAIIVLNFVSIIFVVLTKVSDTVKICILPVWLIF